MKLSFEIFVHARPEEIWLYYENLEKWYVWESSLQDITLNGAFQTGTTGQMKLADSPPIQFTLSSVIKNREFIDVASTPMGEMAFEHYIIPIENGSIIRHEVALNSQNKEHLDILRNVFNDVPLTVFTLKEVVENAQ